jgi:hypothetical protein
LQFTKHRWENVHIMFRQEDHLHPFWAVDRASG